ncbi:hypothetical protein BaRGS_00039148 [Batillaria attramentaria]|uniref:Uncharacterized protein n=1 Tax=Batillaria attramentaria TaxID=370345 RepID=A0ABD0J3V5_9CAEN
MAATLNTTISTQADEHTSYSVTCHYSLDKGEHFTHLKLMRGSDVISVMDDEHTVPYWSADVSESWRRRASLDGQRSSRYLNISSTGRTCDDNQIVYKCKLLFVADLEQKTIKSSVTMNADGCDDVGEASHAGMIAVGSLFLAFIVLGIIPFILRRHITRCDCLQKKTANSYLQTQNLKLYRNTIPCDSENSPEVQVHLIEQNPRNTNSREVTFAAVFKGKPSSNPSYPENVYHRLLDQPSNTDTYVNVQADDVTSYPDGQTDDISASAEKQPATSAMCERLQDVSVEDSDSCTGLVNRDYLAHVYPECTT